MPDELGADADQRTVDDIVAELLKRTMQAGGSVDLNASAQLDPMSAMLEGRVEPLNELQPTGETYNVGGAQLPISPNVVDRRNEPRLPLIKQHLYEQAIRPFEEAYEDIRSGNLRNIFRERPEYGDGGINILGGPPDFTGTSDSIWDMKERMLMEGKRMPPIPGEGETYPDEDETMLGVP